MTERTTLAYPRSWPGVLPLDDAASLLGMKPDALRQRFRRGKQPGSWQGRRVFITLTPAQWADWSLTSEPARSVERPAGPRANVESGTHRGRTPPQPAAPTTGAEGVLVLLAQLEAARRREVELAGQVGFLLERVRALEAANEQPALPRPAPWWVRWLPWLAPSSPRSSLEPGPSQR
jgi:hypothetical protein